MQAATGDRATVAASVAILVAVSVGVGLLLVAMSRYPGGTAMDATAPGHSFWLNFLCDLTGEVALDGRPNQVAAWCARAALACFGVALVCFWLIVPTSFGPQRVRGLALAIRMAGMVSVMALLTVPWASGRAHVAAVFASAVPALIAGLLAVAGTFRYARSALLMTVSSATVVASAAGAILYARSYMVEPRVVVPALPFFQRLAMLLMLAWMALVALRALTSVAYSATNR